MEPTEPKSPKPLNPPKTKFRLSTIILASLSALIVLLLITQLRSSPPTDETLRRNLSSNDMQTRWEAFHHLANHRQTWLAELSLSDDPKIKEQAIRTIRSHNVTTALPYLRQIVENDPDPKRAKSATNAIELLGSPPWNLNTNIP